MSLQRQTTSANSIIASKDLTNDFGLRWTCSRLTLPRTIIQAIFIATMTMKQSTVPKVDFQLMRIEIFEVVAKIFVEKERGDAFQNHRVRLLVQMSMINIRLSK